jgi:predicted flap endonuclease-1-like 5' DNA nuclease
MTSNHTSNGTTGGGVLVRPRYFPRQMVTADDLTTDQAYLRERLRRHNRYLHGCGVVCGLEVVQTDPDEDGTAQVIVTPGYALGPYGDEIYVSELQTVRLDCITPAKDCADLDDTPATMPGNVVLRYRETEARPVPALAARCAPRTSCEFSRFRDEFELGCIEEMPEGCSSLESGSGWGLRNLLIGRRRPPDSLEDVPAIFQCPEESASPWLVLARVSLNEDGLIIDYEHRDQTLSSWQMMEFLKHVRYAPPGEGADRPASDVNGIGPVRTALLGEHGVLTVGQLAAMRAEVVAEIVGVAEIRARGMIAQARYLAYGRYSSASNVADRPVSDVNGVGRVRTRLLNDSGITTIGQLARMRSQAVSEILGVAEIRARGMLAQARFLARGGQPRWGSEW